MIVQRFRERLSVPPDPVTDTIKCRRTTALIRMELLEDLVARKKVNFTLGEKNKNSNIVGFGA